MAKVLVYGLEESELPSCNHFHFQTNTLGKGIETT